LTNLACLVLWRPKLGCCRCATLRVNLNKPMMQKRSYAVPAAGRPNILSILVSSHRLHKYCWKKIVSCQLVFGSKAQRKEVCTVLRKNVL
jgi:hypothetical protein